MQRGDVSASVRNSSLSGIGDVNPRAGYTSSWVTPQRHNWQVIPFFWLSFWRTTVRVRGRTIKSAFILAGRAVFNVKAPPFVETLSGNTFLHSRARVRRGRGASSYRKYERVVEMSRLQTIQCSARRIKCQTRDFAKILHESAELLRKFLTGVALSIVSMKFSLKT